MTDWHLVDRAVSAMVVELLSMFRRCSESAVPRVLLVSRTIRQPNTVRVDAPNTLFMLTVIAVVGITKMVKSFFSVAVGFPRWLIVL